MTKSSIEETVRCNVADRLAAFAMSQPDQVAIAFAKPGRRPRYDTITFADLDRQSTRIARGLLRHGIAPGTRLAMLVPFGIDFIRLVLALLKAGMVQVLVDPGMGKKNLIECLAESKPQGFVGIPKAQVARLLYRKRFPEAKQNICVGGSITIGGVALSKIEALGEQPLDLPVTSETESAAVIFTTGSTGPPKGVAYTHGTFEHQVRLIQQQYNVTPGTVDLACFPLFGLFDAVMGVTTVIPDMDPTRPADADPEKILAAIRDWKVTQAFGSPALWHTVSKHCVGGGIFLPTVRRVLSAGAPVPPQTLAAVRKMIHTEGEVFTPYGATESLPVASIESREVLDETAAKTRQGKGTCVGHRFADMMWQVVEIDDGPIAEIGDAKPVSQGTIGELMVSGPVVTRNYVTRQDQNAIHKVQDGSRIWHRMGDVGYLDDQDRFWFCGRKAHRVETPSQTLFTICCEAVFNEHPDVYRTALVGHGVRGQQTPVLIVEPHADRRPKSPAEEQALVDALKAIGNSHPHTAEITDIRIYPERLPVDIRHNSKIFREQLAQWVK
ncbi:fatty acid CoA ligase family protein [Rosistilla oblonga]|uniref:fatty acid CoA ligase family protein n=1 Tax=Rosistilla oblonga TaxID=2527990 RepID=UPI003A9748A3